MRLLCLGTLGLLAAVPLPLRAQPRFADDFEGGLSGWEVRGPEGRVSIQPSGDDRHGRVLVLAPDGDVLALVRGSGGWGPVRIEGEVRFPTATDAYLGVAYSVRRRGPRTDFGLIYIKGGGKEGGSYLRVNPHRDLNVGRTLYEDYRTPLAGEAAVRVGEWQRFAAEVVADTCHFYVGDMETPRLTFAHLELDSGAVGLQPRSVGGEVWVDDVRVTSIARLSYRGPPLPAVDHRPDSLLTAWEVVGPLERTEDGVARDPEAASGRWRPFETDGRGAVVTGRVVDYHGPRTVAYFRTRVRAERDGEAVLHLSTVDDLALWVNGRFHWFVPRQALAWHDFWRNPDHAGRRIPVPLRAGTNELVLRVRGGTYATGGFFARIEPAVRANGDGPTGR